jgi:DNA-binding GntR family transcriptional regulator
MRAMKGRLPQLRPAAIRRDVADIIREALLSGHFAPGQGLSEVALAAELSVSRGPVREALLILAEEGLVAHTQNRGFSVVEVSERDRKEISQVRMPLEVLALEQARPRATAADLKSIEELKDRVLTVFASGDFHATTRIDLEFHQAIWQLSANEWLLAALKRVVVPYFAFGMVFGVRPAALSYELMLKRHDVYLDYLRGDDSLTAEECVRLHLSADPK